MLFTSTQYIFLFLPLVLVLLRFVNKTNVQLILPFLIICSLYFYSVWDFKFLFLLIFSIIFNYFVGKNILSTFKNKKKYLYAGILINISILAYFKYLNFFIENVNQIFASNFDIIYIIFPLALSFYTIQQIAFLVDCFDGRINKINFTKYSLFISFFPQLVAGPIVLYKEAYHQYEKSNISQIDYKNLYLGLIIFTIGISKKVLLADTLAIPVNEAFGSNYKNWGFDEAWLGSLLFTFQIYFDFSGYTDMAIGAALLFNIHLPINFNSPLKAKSIITFWQKWHITLSNFINQYCFYKLVKKFRIKKSFLKYLSILFVMTMAGLWHGPTWGYIFFGVVHGIALIINHIWKITKIKLIQPIGWILTFVVINVGFVFFRSPNLEIAFWMIKKMFSFNEAKIFIQELFFNDKSIFEYISQITTLSTTVCYTFFVGIIVVFFSNNSNFIIKNYSFKFYHLFFYSLILLLSILRIRGVEFIYFEF